MKYGLGIDTGGTYTDAAVFDFETNSILRTAKSLTLKENLALCIDTVLDELPRDMLMNLKFIALSTTLATNACVEGKGSRVIPVFIGCDEAMVRKYGHKYGLPATGDMIFLDGGHNQQGDVIAKPDWKYLEERVSYYRQRTDSFIVTQMWGMRNPEFEKEARKLIEQWSGLPVLCAHELLGQLNFMKRAASAMLNAQLIPLINEFMDAVRTSLKKRNITAPIVIVRGDGSLMSEEFAREKPIETLLSGPASSVAGGLRLSGKKDCVIVDMGGTTSDIAIVKDGRARLSDEGLSVGNWVIGARSILMKTVGLGGDSRIAFDSGNNVVIEPQRVAPLSWLAWKWPGVMDRIEYINIRYKKHTRWLLDFFYLLKDISGNVSYSDEERRIAAALENGPLSIMELAEETGSTIYDFKPKKLEQYGIIMRSGLTPTDIMHITGDYRVWNEEAATVCAQTMAGRLGMSLGEFIHAVDTKIKEKLYINILKLLLENENGNLPANRIVGQTEELMMMGYHENNTNTGFFSGRKFVSCNYTTGFDFVGIGAPTHVYLPDIAKCLGASCTIPENAAIANAIGAITGSIMVEETIAIRPRFEVYGIKSYTCYSSECMKEFAGYDEALKWAKRQASHLAGENALARGASGINITIDINDSSIELFKAATGGNVPEGDGDNMASADGSTPEGGGGTRVESNRLLLETVVTARAAGTVKWL